MAPKTPSVDLTIVTKNLRALLKVLDSVAADARKGIGAGVAPVVATAG